MKVRKRDGSIQKFDLSKIENAIKKANVEVDEYYQILESDIPKMLGNIYYEITSGICNSFLSEYVVDIEEIQDAVELCLQKEGYYKLAKHYIKYRYQRELVRESKKYLMDEVAEKLEAINVQNQNANLDEKSFGGRMGEANRVVMKDYALNNCMSKMSKENHLNNEIYIHDLDSYAVGMHNCLSIPFDKILAKGFNTRQTDVRPANSINTAFQLVAVIFQLQSLQQFGGVSSTHLDWTMVPYVRKSFRKHYIDGLKYIEGIDVEKLDYQIQNDLSIEDEEYKLYPKVYNFAIDMTIKETKQAVEGMFHNLNY